MERLTSCIRAFSRKQLNNRNQAIELESHQMRISNRLRTCQRDIRTIRAWQHTQIFDRRLRLMQRSFKPFRPWRAQQFPLCNRTKLSVQTRKIRMRLTLAFVINIASKGERLRDIESCACIWILRICTPIRLKWGTCVVSRQSPAEEGLEYIHRTDPVNRGGLCVGVEDNE